jgi:hypothetical protein
MKKQKNKKIATNAVLRKESKSFPGWFKYEVTLKDSNGIETRIPAYGKDLQDALSRVVHDDKIKKYRFIIEKIPAWVWAAVWFVVLTSVSMVCVAHKDQIGEYMGLIFVGTLGILGTLTVSINNWFTLRNKNK